MPLLLYFIQFNIRKPANKWVKSDKRKNCFECECVKKRYKLKCVKWDGLASRGHSKGVEVDIDFQFNLNRF